MTDEQAVRERIQELCRKQGITIMDLEKRCNVDPGILRAIDAGTNLKTPIEQIEEICDAFRINLADFFVNDTFRNVELSE